MPALRKRITIVDDDEAIRDAVRLMLERRGYAVALLSNGESLLQGSFEVPDLFILDKQLPGVDGLDLCRYLKGQARTRSTPVLMLSASPQIRHQLRDACADGFLEKPFRMQALRELADQLVISAATR